MSKEKQIAEMAKAMCGNGMPNGNCATDDEPCHLECVYGCCAERLYAAGYRRQSEGEWKWIADDDVICSACGKVFFSADNADAGTSLWHFCPNCGAKMKGEQQ